MSNEDGDHVDDYHCFIYRKWVFLIIIIKSLSIFKAGIASEGHRLRWGSSQSASIFHGVGIVCKFDIEEKFAILDVKDCGVRFKFRSYNPRNPANKQHLMPGLSIKVPATAIFTTNEKTERWKILSSKHFLAVKYLNGSLVLCGAANETFVSPQANPRPLYVTFFLSFHRLLSLDMSNIIAKRSVPSLFIKCVVTSNING